jgi:hypothetical protein
MNENAIKSNYSNFPSLERGGCIPLWSNKQPFLWEKTFGNIKPDYCSIPPLQSGDGSQLWASPRNASCSKKFGNSKHHRLYGKRPSVTIAQVVTTGSIGKIISSFFTANEWRQHFSLTSQLNPIRKSTIHFDLNTHFSVQYYLNPGMKNKILSRVEDSETQISLNLEKRVWLSSDPAITKLYLSRIDNVYFCNVSCNEALEDLTEVKNVRKLNCSRCYNLVTLSSELKNLEELNLVGCRKFANFNTLPVHSLQFLKIADNGQLRDVSPFKTIPTVTLIACNNVTDISPLQDIRKLTVNQCIRIQNFTTLTNVKHLNIAKNHQLQFLPAINHGITESISFDYCDKIVDIDALKETLPDSVVRTFSPPSGGSPGTNSYHMKNNGSDDTDDDLSLSTFRSTFDEIAVNASGQPMDCQVAEPESKLKEISMVGCHDIEDLSPLMQLSALRKVTVCPCMRESTRKKELMKSRIKFEYRKCIYNEKKRNLELIAAMNAEREEFWKKYKPFLGGYREPETVKLQFPIVVDRAVMNSCMFPTNDDIRGSSASFDFYQ